MKAGVNPAAGCPPVGGEDAEGAAGLGQGRVWRQQMTAIESPGVAVQAAQQHGQFAIAMLDPGIKDSVEGNLRSVCFAGQIGQYVCCNSAPQDEVGAPGAEVRGQGFKGLVEPPKRGGAGRSDPGRLIKNIDRKYRTPRLQRGGEGGIVRKPQVAAKPQDDGTHARSMGEGAGLI